MAARTAVENYLNQLLQPERFKDYGPNGLQVEGRAEIRHVVSGVTASLDLIDAAIEAQADALFVHHGLFWRGHDGRLTGWLKKRVERLLAHGINLFAYHLPLDAHAVFGNNAQWAARMGWQIEGRFGEQDLGFWGASAQLIDVDTLALQIARVLGRQPVVAAGDGRPLKRVAWCTGGAQGFFEGAIGVGADVYLTGEISEPQAHLAKETGVAFLACGHHATERWGALAVGQALADELGLSHQFIDLDNPA